MTALRVIRGGELSGSTAQTPATALPSGKACVAVARAYGAVAFSSATSKGAENMALTVLTW